MAVVSVFNPKGGVGKTTLAVNLAWEAAQAGFRTLLWDIDEQGDSRWLLDDTPEALIKPGPHWIPGAMDPATQIRTTRFERLSLIAADDSMRRTDNWFAEIARGQRLAKMFAALERDFDVIILDCPPGFGEANRTIMAFAHMVVVPCIPAPLAMRGFLRVRDFLIRQRGAHPPMLPVFSMVDKRRRLHRDAVIEHADWPVIPTRSAIERMAEQRAPLGAHNAGNEARHVFRILWEGIHRKLSVKRAIRSLVTGQTSAPTPLPASPRDRRPALGSAMWPGFRLEA